MRRIWTVSPLQDVYTRQDYMTTARYRDKAIGKFVEYLKTLPQYDVTLIVITGDHEGLATYREESVSYTHLDVNKRQHHFV